MSHALESAQFFFERGRYPEAIEQAQSAAADPEHRIIALYLMGLSGLHLEDSKLVKSSARSILSEDPDSPEGHDLLGYYFWIGKQLDKGERHFREALRQDSFSGFRYANLARLVAQKSRLEDAITIAYQGLEVEPQSLYLLTTLQTLYRHNKQPKQAQRIEEQVQAINPESAENHLEAGFRLLSIGQSEEATGRLSEALRLNPADDEDLELIALNKIASHPLFRHGLFLRTELDLMLMTLLVPAFWYGLSFLWHPIVYIAWLSLALILLAFAHRGLFSACRWWTLRQLRSGRL